MHGGLQLIIRGGGFHKAVSGRNLGLPLWTLISQDNSLHSKFIRHGSTQKNSSESPSDSTLPKDVTSEVSSNEPQPIGSTPKPASWFLRLFKRVSNVLDSDHRKSKRKDM
jgi:hypothetical protein